MRSPVYVRFHFQFMSHVIMTYKQPSLHNSETNIIMKKQSTVKLTDSLLQRYEKVVIMVFLCNTADHYVFMLWFLILYGRPM